MNGHSSHETPSHGSFTPKIDALSSVMMNLSLTPEGSTQTETPSMGLKTPSVPFMPMIPEQAVL